LRTEKQNAEDAAWQERNEKKQFENELFDLRSKLKEAVSKNSDL